MTASANRILTILKSILISYIFTGIVLLILSVLLLKTDVSYNFLRGGMIFSYLFSSLVAGFLTGRSVKVRRFLWGMLAGFLYFALLFLVSFFMNSFTITAPATMVMIFVMCILGGMFGGMFG
jgi:putative membrane protein (TIGR04086 family)